MRGPPPPGHSLPRRAVAYVPFRAQSFGEIGDASICIGISALGDQWGPEDSSRSALTNVQPLVTLTPIILILFCRGLEMKYGDPDRPDDRMSCEDDNWYEDTEGDGLVSDD